MKNCLVKNILDSFPGESGAFQVICSLQTLTHSLPILLADRLLLVLGQLVQGCSVTPQVNFSSQEQERSVGAVMLDFWNKNLLCIFEWGRLSHREADKEDWSIWVTERSQSVVVLPPSCIPELKIAGFFANWHLLNIAVKNRRDVFGREFTQTISYA